MPKACRAGTRSGVVEQLAKDSVHIKHGRLVPTFRCLLSTGQPRLEPWFVPQMGGEHTGADANLAQGLPGAHTFAHESHDLLPCRFTDQLHIAVRRWQGRSILAMQLCAEPLRQ
jgi:hypothetical protein